MRASGAVKMSGDLGLKVMRTAPVLHPTIEKPSVLEVLRHGMPDLQSTPDVRAWRGRNFRNVWRGARHWGRALRSPAPAMLGALYLTAREGDDVVGAHPGVSSQADGLRARGLGGPVRMAI